MGEPYNKHYVKRRKMLSDIRYESGSQFNHEYNKFNNQDYYELKAEHILNGTLFEDPSFSADCTLLNHTADEKNVSSSNNLQCEPTTTEWLRPHVSYPL